MLELAIPTIPSQSASVSVGARNFRPLLEKDPGDVGEELQKRGRGSLESGGKHHLQGLCRIMQNHFVIVEAVQQPRECDIFQKEQSETVQSDQSIQTHSDTYSQTHTQERESITQ